MNCWGAVNVHQRENQRLSKVIQTRITYRIGRIVKRELRDQPRWTSSEAREARQEP